MKSDRVAVDSAIIASGEAIQRPDEILLIGPRQPGFIEDVLC